MSSVLLETDILIEVLRRRDSSLLPMWDRLADSKQLITYSPRSAAKLWRGMRDRKVADLVELLESLECITIDGEIGRRAGEYLRQFGPSCGLGIADALIAATATVHGQTLWTRNRKHYSMKDIVHFAGI